MFCLTECSLFVNVALCFVLCQSLSLKFIVSCSLLAQVSDNVFPDPHKHFPLYNYCHVLAQQHAWYIFLLCDALFHEAVEYMCWLSVLILLFFHRHFQTHFFPQTNFWWHILINLMMVFPRWGLVTTALSLFCSHRLFKVFERMVSFMSTTKY